MSSETANHKNDYIVRATAANGQVRAFAATSNNLVHLFCYFFFYLCGSCLAVNQFIMHNSQYINLTQLTS